MPKASVRIRNREAADLGPCVRALAVGIAKAWVNQQSGEEKSDEPEPVPHRKSKRETLSPVSS